MTTRRQARRGRVLARWWRVLLAVVVIAVAGFTVSRLHGIFGSDNRVSADGTLPNESSTSKPKRVLIEVFGDPGASATITYLDVDAQPQRVDDAPLPWSYDVTTTLPAVFTNVSAQGDGFSLGCRITIDGDVKDERTVTMLNAFTYCLEKSG
ncbi:MmpS family transport accessory protein [Mycobacterium sp.]|uniref:MmpS family transport accessory protein n=1 Tax=Mycobacterium sp. TaxID=1785 RepID=UPI003A8BAA30